MKIAELREITGAGMAPMFYIDGARVTREAYQSLKDRAYAAGGLCNISTKGRDMGQGRIRRTNFSTAILEA